MNDENYREIIIPASDAPPEIDPAVPFQYGINALFDLTLTDTERHVLNALLIRAGLAWVCGCRAIHLLWSPPGPATCEFCGADRPIVGIQKISISKIG